MDEGLPNNVLTGWQTRNHLANELLGEGYKYDFEGNKKSLSREHFIHTFRKEVEFSACAEISLIRILHSYKTPEERRAFLGLFRGSGLTDYFDILALGGLYSESLAVKKGWPESSLDSSLIFEAKMFHECIAPKGTGVPVEGKLPAAKIFHNHPSTFRAFESAIAKVISSDDFSSIDCFGNFLVALKVAKIRLWSICGVDTFGLLEKLLELRLMSDGFNFGTGLILSKKINLDRLFKQLVLMRVILFGLTITDKNPSLGAVLDEMELLLPAELHDGFKDLQTRNRKMERVNVNSLRGHIYKVIGQSINVQRSILRSNVQLLDRELVKLAELDDHVLRYINWNEVHNLKTAAPYYTTIEKAYVGLIFDKTYVREIFPIVAFARGNADFISAMRVISSSIRADKKGLDSVVKSIRALPRLPRSQLALSLLNKKNLRKLASSFPKPIENTDISATLHNFDNLVSSLRVDLASRFEALKIIRPWQADKIINEEEDYYRLQHFFFEEQYGVLRVNWPQWNHKIREILSSSPILFNNRVISQYTLTGEDSSSLEIKRKVSEVVSNRICNELLVSDSESLNSLLNDNIRHSTLVPRFRRAFNEAVQEIHKSANSRISLDDDEAKELFGDYYPHMRKFRKEIEGRVLEFSRLWLTVYKERSFLAEARSTVAKSIIESTADKEDMALNISSILKTSIESLLYDCKAHLHRSVRSDINNILVKYRKMLDEEKHPQISQFYDNLHTGFGAAVKDVTNWLRLSERTGVGQDFELRHILTYELERLLSARIALANIVSTSEIYNIRSKKYEPGKFQIAGEYNEICDDIIKNLLVNSTKYSGQHLNTEIEFQFRLRGNDILIRCSNTMSPEGLKDAVTSYQRTIELLSLPPEVLAQQNTESGFAKIKVKAKKKFDLDLLINIPPVNYESSLYLVEVTLKSARDLMCK